MSNPEVFLVVWLIGVLLVWPPWFWMSVRSRRMRGEPIIPRPPATASFCERRASGTLRGTFGGARNCLMVSITGDQLWVTPTFPFNMIAPHGVMGLEHRIAKADVISLDLRKTWRGHTVTVGFRRLGDRPGLLELKLHDPEGFFAALGLRARTPI